VYTVVPGIFKELPCIMGVVPIDEKKPCMTIGLLAGLLINVFNP
jgi:hypothetical protein